MKSSFLFLILLCLVSWITNAFLFQNDIAAQEKRSINTLNKSVLQTWKPYCTISNKSDLNKSFKSIDQYNRGNFTDSNYEIKSGNIFAAVENIPSSYYGLTEWQRMDNPTGGCVRRFYQFNHIIYAVTDQDLYRYENNRWNSLHMDNTLTLLEYCSMHIFNSGRMLASGDYLGLYCSDNNGKGWYPFQIGSYDYMNISVQDYLQLSNTDVLLATSKGIFVTKDDGVNFSLLSMQDTLIKNIKIDKSGNIWVSTQYGVYKSNNYNNNLVWQKINIDNVEQAKILIDSKGRIYLRTLYKIYKSTDSGLSWDYLDGFFQDITMDQSNNLVITGNKQIFFADDQGIKSASSPSRLPLLTTFITENGEYYAGLLGSGIAIYDKMKDTFNDFSDGINSATVRTILPMTNGSVLISTDSYSFFKSKDNGTTWERNYDYRSLFMITDKNNSIYAAGNSGIIRSDDFSRTWKPLNINVAPYYISSFDISDDGKVIYAGSSHGEVYVSDDAGNNFKKVQDENGSFVDAIKIIGQNSFLIYRGLLYVTYDNGVTLIPIEDKRLQYITEIVKDNGGYIYLATKDGVYRSQDIKNWTQLPLLGSEYFDVYRPAFLRLDSSGNIYAVTINGLVQVSKNNGESWLPVINSMPYVYAWSFAMTKDGYFFLGSQNKGLFKTKINLTHAENTTSVIKRMSLSNNFPNPFNSTTKIEYEIPKDSYVTLKIYSLLGQEIETLTSGFKKSGSYFDIWDATKYPSGIYIYKLQSDNQSQIKKLILLR